MVWTYSGDPSSNAKDEVRFLVGDTTEADPIVQDEEITFVLLQHPKTTGRINYRAGSVVASMIAAKFARRADRSIGSLSISAKQQRDHYVELAQTLNKQADGGGRLGGVALGVPLLGGGGAGVLDRA